MNGEIISRLIIAGASGHARVAADIASLSGFEIVGFIDDLEKNVDATFLHKAILGGRDLIPKLAIEKAENIFVAIGNSQIRAELAWLVQQSDLSVPVLAHPLSIISDDVQIGDGTLVAAGAIVNPNVTIGDYAIVNTGSIVEHDCKIGKLAHISPGATLAGGVVVGESTWIGAGATVLERCRIGANSVVGAGSVVISDVGPNQKVVGVPARSIGTVL